MYEHEDGNRNRRADCARTLPADEGDARAWARRALQDAYDWRDDEPAARTTVARPGGSPPDARSAAARAEARRSRREVTRSISRTVGV